MFVCLLDESACWVAGRSGRHVHNQEGGEVEATQVMRSGWFQMHLKLELSGFAGRLDVGCKRRQGWKQNFGPVKLDGGVWETQRIVGGGA